MDSSYTDEGITSLSVRGFKSIADESRIELRPLTILAGANSSGKSSIIQPLLLMKQTLEATYDPGALYSDGPLLQFTSSDQLLSSKPVKSKSFSLSLELSNSDRLEIEFGQDKKVAFVVNKMKFTRNNNTLDLKVNMTSEEIKNITAPYLEKGIFSLLSGNYNVIEEMEKDKTTNCKIKRDRCFLTVFFVVPKDNSELEKERMMRWISWIPTTIGADLNIFQHNITNLIHLPAWRGSPKRIYNKTAVGDVFPGRFTEYFPGIIVDWYEKDKLYKLNACLKQLGLTWKVMPKIINETQVELHVGRTCKSVRGGGSDTVNIADVGFGVSQVLPILVALLVARKGQTVHIEEPEIHLHPAAQRDLAKIITTAVNRGVRVIMETHSSILLLGVQTLVAKGEMAADDVKLHWFSRNKKDGTAKIEPGDLDKNGAYGDWPVDFDDVSLEQEEEYLDTVQR